MSRSLLLISLVVMIGCGPGSSSGPSDYFNEFELTGLMTEVVHYAAKLPPNSNHEIKFQPRFDEYYAAVASEYKWAALKPRKEGGYYFLITRPARSIDPMFEDIGGYFNVEKDSLVEYDELFRTWKLPEGDLEARGKLLFDRMVEGKDLTMYYSKFQGDKYIEFPDGRYVFDKGKRRWKDSVGN